MDTPKLGIGRIIETHQHKDAVHMAVAPVTAGEKLLPGTHAAIVKGMAVASKEPIGVIDPFLRQYVECGQKCWLFLYPGSITSLRHEWTHTAFDSADESEAWLRAYASRVSPYEKDPDEAYKSLIDDLKEQRIFYYGRECHSLDDVEDQHELKQHAEKLLGIRIDWNNFEFTCSC